MMLRTIVLWILLGPARDPFDTLRVLAACSATPLPPIRFASAPPPYTVRSIRYEDDGWYCELRNLIFRYPDGIYYVKVVNAGGPSAPVRFSIRKTVVSVP